MARDRGDETNVVGSLDHRPVSFVCSTTAVDGHQIWDSGANLMGRLMNINHPERPLSAEDARFDSYLPVDDGAFDDGVRTSYGARFP